MSAAQPAPFWPYAVAYSQQGWSPFPLPARAKNPPPRGVIGRGGKPPTLADCTQWATPNSNIAVLMPKNVACEHPYSVIGIDVDEYGNKHGGDTIRCLAIELGGWPRTWRSTSRGLDNPSGIRLFKVAAGVELEEKRLPDCEIIQNFNRYAVAWPSVHPEGRRYEWITPENKLANPTLSSEDNQKVVVPDHRDLPWLPQKWLNHLYRGMSSTGNTTYHVSDASIKAWLDEHYDGNEPCAGMRRVLEVADDDLHRPGSRHSSMLRGTGQVVRATERGHQGLHTALSELCSTFLVVTSTDSSRPRKEDFNRAVRGAIRKVFTEPNREYERDECFCALSESLDDIDIEYLMDVWGHLND